MYMLPVQVPGPERELQNSYKEARKGSVSLKPSDVVRCLSSEQRLSEFHTPEDSQSFKPLSSPFPAWEAEPPELHRGVEADRKAAQSGVSQVGLKHD